MYEMYVGAAILIFAIYTLVTEKFPIHITSLLIIFLSLMTKTISTQEFLLVFSNPAPIIIICMFIISSALNETGIINALGAQCLKAVDYNRNIAIIGLFLLTMVLSAFINNTPVVLILTPIVIMIAQKLNDYPSRFLLPLSFVSILGGMCTLIGTSTNILVAEKAQQLGLAEFTIFEISIPAIFLAIIGCIYMATIGRALLPKYQFEIQNESESEDDKNYLSELMIPSGSSLIGKKINDFDMEGTDFELMDIIRDNMSFRNHFLVRKEFLGDKEISIGDKIVIRSRTDEILKIKELFDVSSPEESRSSAFDYFGTKKVVVIEGIVNPNSRLIGLRASKIKFRRLYNCYLIAVHRNKQNLKQDFDKIIIEDGDILLLEGAEEELNRAMMEESITSINRIPPRKVRKQRSILSLLAIIFVVAGSSLRVMPIAGLACIAASFVIITKCISLNKAIKSIEWGIIILILSMLTLSTVMRNSGILDVVVNSIKPYFSKSSPVLLLAFVYIISWLFTELMSNNAVALLITPIAIQLALHLGLDPRPYTIAVMFASSASFSTPIGYQTNTFIHAVGNYKFTDFMKIGIPLNLILLASACYIIPNYWELSIKP